MHGINNFWMRGLIVVVMSVVVCAVVDAQVSYPSGTVIEVTDDGVVVTAPDAPVVAADDGGEDDSNDNNDNNNGGGTYVADADPSDYCYGADYALVDCEASRNYDPWIANNGERSYRIRNRLTLAIPFTLPARNDSQAQADVTRYGYFQITSGERVRDIRGEDIFHVWFSEEPNGDPLGGTKCEMWAVRAKGNLYWTQDETVANQVCFLGHDSRVLYANFETACLGSRYEGECSKTNKQKSYRAYQFDVSRRAKGY